jgi:hypothetical protein
MAYDTKALLSSLSQGIARTKTAKEAYSVVVKTANVEGLQLPTYEEAIQEIEELRKSE